MSDLHTLTLDDWLALLGLAEPIDDLQDGRTDPSSVRSLIADAVTVYPNAMGDYVRVLESLSQIVEDVESAIDDQNDMLEEFADGLDEVGLSYVWDNDRLLNSAERAYLAGLQSELESTADDLEQQAEDAEDAISVPTGALGAAVC